MRFLVDENLPVDIGLFLEAAGYDVLIVRRSSLVGSSDRVLWARAVKDERIIVTRNHDFPLVGVVGKPGGIILLRPVNDKPSAILGFFKEFWASADVSSLPGRIIVVQPGRTRSRAL